MIITDEKLLRVRCDDASSEEVGEIVDKLESELKLSAKLGRPGIGLAAPQIGIYKNVAIIRLGNKPEHQINLVNCKITKGWDPFEFKGEGCLSFPDRIENTIRYNEILIENNLVLPNRMIATGIFAVAIQHELNHVEGKLFFDFITKVKKPKPNDFCLCGKKNNLSGLPLKYKKCCGK